MTNGHDDSNDSSPPNDWAETPQSVDTQQQTAPASQPVTGDQPPVVRPTNKPKPDNNDILAVVLSIFFPGVGQIMLGQTTKGIVMLVVAFFTCAAGGLLSIAAGLDAYCVAMAKKKRPIGDWEFFPDINDAF